jgi:hypothetical protein
MISIGHNSWLSMNLGTRNFIDPLYLAINKNTSNTPTDFKDAARKNAQLISNKFDNLYLCLSGGFDSEFVASTFLSNNIAFTPVIVLTPTNKLETWHAQYFCFKNNLIPVLLDYSNIDKYNDFVRRLMIKSIKMDVLPIVALVPNLIADTFPNAHIVTGYGDPFHHSIEFSEPMGEVMEVSAHDFYLELENGDAHPGAFFTYTPEFFVSYVSSIDYSLNTQVAKTKLYELSPRSKIPISIINSTVLAELKYIYDKQMGKYGMSSKDNFTFSIEKSDLLARISGLSASSRYTNSAAYAII